MDGWIVRSIHPSIQCIHPSVHPSIYPAIHTHLRKTSAIDFYNLFRVDCCQYLAMQAGGFSPPTVNTIYTVYPPGIKRDNGKFTLTGKIMYEREIVHGHVAAQESITRSACCLTTSQHPQIVGFLQHQMTL